MQPNKLRPKLIVASESTRVFVLPGDCSLSPRVQSAEDAVTKPSAVGSLGKTTLRRVDKSDVASAARYRHADSRPETRTFHPNKTHPKTVRSAQRTASPPTRRSASPDTSTENASESALFSRREPPRALFEPRRGGGRSAEISASAALSSLTLDDGHIEEEEEEEVEEKEFLSPIKQQHRSLTSSDLIDTAPRDADRDRDRDIRALLLLLNDKGGKGEEFGPLEMMVEEEQQEQM
jgi:hypothetical protein